MFVWNTTRDGTSLTVTILVSDGVRSNDKSLGSTVLSYSLITEAAQEFQTAGADSICDGVSSGATMTMKQGEFGSPFAANSPYVLSAEDTPIEAIGCVDYFNKNFPTSVDQISYVRCFSWAVWGSIIAAASFFCIVLFIVLVMCCCPILCCVGVCDAICC